MPREMNGEISSGSQKGRIEILVIFMTNSSFFPDAIARVEQLSEKRLVKVELLLSLLLSFFMKFSEFAHAVSEEGYCRCT